MPSSSAGITSEELELIKAFRRVYINLRHCGVVSQLEMIIEEYAELLDLLPSELLDRILPPEQHIWMTLHERETVKAQQDAWRQTDDAVFRIKLHKRFWNSSATLADVSELLASKCRFEEAMRWNLIAQELDMLGDKMWEDLGSEGTGDGSVTSETRSASDSSSSLHLDHSSSSDPDDGFDTFIRNTRRGLV
ncbi:hypothetical protein K431DRAFT_285174 [Polychaeton citri CBS 116435]|uniref:Uncharacterized protein n=1 Tax=Polychaeton citri CBS 116435 TaxID=1314669 RepID=A0A9P4Q8F2_9PEZI|nr:hypothetical protein K431DRAFT_285174 [Polychaeton citri CBS 116435]